MNNVPYLVLECRVYSVLDNLPRETFVFSYQLRLSDTKAPGVNFINMLTRSFYSRRAQNRKKRQSSQATLCAFGICRHKSCAC